MATATARMTLGSLFATVGTAANAVTSTLNTTVDAISMLDRYVSDARERQTMRSAVEKLDFTQRLAEEKATEMSERQLQVLEFCAQSADHKRMFETNYDRIIGVLNKLEPSESGQEKGA